MVERRTLKIPQLPSSEQQKVLDEINRDLVKPTQPQMKNKERTIPAMVEPNPHYKQKKYPPVKKEKNTQHPRTPRYIKQTIGKPMTDKFVMEILRRIDDDVKEGLGNEGSDSNGKKTGSNDYYRSRKPIIPEGVNFAKLREKYGNPSSHLSDTHQKVWLLMNEHLKKYPKSLGILEKYSPTLHSRLTRYLGMGIEKVSQNTITKEDKISGIKLVLDVNKAIDIMGVVDPKQSGLFQKHEPPSFDLKPELVRPYYLYREHMAKKTPEYSKLNKKQTEALGHYLGIDNVPLNMTQIAARFSWAYKDTRRTLNGALKQLNIHPEKDAKS